MLLLVRIIIVPLHSKEQLYVWWTVQFVLDTQQVSMHSFLNRYLHTNNTHNVRCMKLAVCADRAIFSSLHVDNSNL